MNIFNQEYSNHYGKPLCTRLLLKELQNERRDFKHLQQLNLETFVERFVLQEICARKSTELNLTYLL